VIKKILYSFIAFLFLAAVTFLLGPTVEITEPTTLDPSVPEGPAALEFFIDSQESRFKDIRSRRHRMRIVWAFEDRRKTPTALVYLHGFSASPMEISPVTEKVGKNHGANVFFARLAGHGRTGNALAQTTATEWISDAVFALSVGLKIGKRVILVGSSTGGSLAIWLAHRFSQYVESIVLISPNFRLANPVEFILTLPWASSYVHIAAGNHYEFKPTNEEHAFFWTTRYPSNVLVEMASLVKFVREMSHEKLYLPILLLYHPKDKVVSVKAMLEFFDKLPPKGKQILPIPEGRGHLLTGDIVSPQTTDKVVGLITDFISGK